MKRKNLAIAALATAIGSVSASAATITQVNTNGTGGNWNATGAWSNGEAPSAGNDYVSGATFRLNSPTSTGPSTFAGDSLRLDGVGLGAANSNSSQLQLFSRNSTEVVTINNLILNGGRMILGVNTDTGDFGVLAGSIQVMANAQIQSGGGARNIEIQSQISGSGTVALSGLGANFYRMTNTSNTFTGLWTVNSSQAIFTDAAAVGGVGSSFNVNGGLLRILAGTWSGDLNAASTGVGSVFADSGVTYNFGAGLTIDSTAFTTAGTYTAAELNTATGTSVFGGTGNFVVIPEPSTALLGLLGTLALLRRRR